MASLSQGAPWILIAFMTLVTLLVLVIKSGASDDEGMIDFMSNLNLHQIFTLEALMKSVIGFLILGIALWSIPTN